MYSIEWFILLMMKVMLSPSILHGHTMNIIENIVFHLTDCK